MMTAESPGGGADILISRLNEGFVLWYGGYTVALTTAEDLAARVLTVAKGLAGETVESPAPVQTVEAVASRPSRSVPPSRELKESTAVPIANNLSLEQQWQNVEKLMAFFGAGFDSNGRVFTRAHWDYALPKFAPNVDPAEAEARLGEFLAELHDD